MVPPAQGPRRVVVRVSRDTIMLVATASVVTFALAYSIRSRPAEAPVVVATAEPQQEKGWAGDLADIAANAPAPGNEQPLTSASLVVPKSALALPAPQPRSAKAKAGCDSASACPGKPPSARPKAAVLAQRDAAESEHEQGLMSRLNPLNHLPDASTLSRPFTYAGNTIAGWIKRF